MTISVCGVCLLNARVADVILEEFTSQHNSSTTHDDDVFRECGRSSKTKWPFLCEGQQNENENESPAVLFVLRTNQTKNFDVSILRLRVGSMITTTRRFFFTWLASGAYHRVRPTGHN